MRNAGFIAFMLACWLLWPGPSPGAAQPEAAAQATERSIKAAYLCKFAGYVEWPDSPAGAGAPLLIGVLESKAMADELTRITAGRRINERPVQIRQVRADESLVGLHVLFVGAHDRNRLDELLQPAQQLPILTVTESDGALDEGSIINFTIDNERVRFEVSLQAAERSHLKLSSRLLAVAQRVRRPQER